MAKDKINARKSQIRLYVEEDLQAAGDPVSLNADQSHYLRNVMRCQAGEEVVLLNGRDGEWLGYITQLGKRGAAAELLEQLRGQSKEPELHLYFAPIKRTQMELLLQKACELGASHLHPVLTQRTQRERFKSDRAEAILQEASEQCERLTVPHLAKPMRLLDALSDLREEEIVWFCDETGDSPPLAKALMARGAADGQGVLVGPEGGFSPEERAKLLDLPCIRPVSLGRRILRAETAALSALAIWQGIYEIKD